MLLDLLRDPLLRSVLMMFWLLPCALQDYRTRRVSNWLTIPLFLIAWPVAILTDHFPLTFAVFVGVYVASELEPRFGGADAKLMVALAGFCPLALGLGILLEVVIFAAQRLRNRCGGVLPGAPLLFVGAVAATVVLLA